MCLGIPGELIKMIQDDGLIKTGKVSFGGIIKDVNLSYTPEANVGDFLIVHVGFAISVIDEKEALKVFDYLNEIGNLEL
ncbi:MAG: HypC/HybG/HupF family hydrogenase formation chaperone [Candidatus Marinimicrobia bacterium]|jgi:hydrogenase expression/formation protein HypC|nr:HypC/HybG/HupF family hydrogenase formation chaperone [Candidatus Neomarinimicrobiota bacterium]MBT3675061.1 HypC/HybG/HupF family hydrogenase formation chaperone [Candidatus Neomarinimicrobiota bacterium]MBT3763630.1 HypC/HybG/HupF family hydrogenase formation chaperone [Candidatus Neomarinimicrobiota bacterium]MBT4068838.1 HypC/HybG/HupF family hydrogenase formation chaperone [Candidatus Neomarinimicrobiota bacterium]MBT4271282.1 HypC/HybG/HupF family hydrogenase formation chaperone [Candi